MLLYNFVFLYISNVCPTIPSLIWPGIDCTCCLRSTFDQGNTQETISLNLRFCIKVGDRIRVGEAKGDGANYISSLFSNYRCLMHYHRWIGRV
jgi:hypothetical protein